MPVTLPNLDDRRYADLVEEARGLVVANAPALTDHNPSDPVITLTELFAYFTEALLYRVNTVTDANRGKFLRLLNGPDRPVPTDSAALDAEVQRTVLDLRRADRAVTIEDFELLATIADDKRRNPDIIELPIWFSLRCPRRKATHAGCPARCSRADDCSQL